MKALRRWFIYRRLVNELIEAPRGTLAELGVTHKALRDFAWHSADAEADRTKRRRDVFRR
jgi:hypothetical protein